jgi:hypothetical protein
MGLVQYAEADPTQAPRILDAMHKFLSLVNTIWKNNQQGDPSLGFQFDYQFVRWEEVRWFFRPTHVPHLSLSWCIPCNGSSTRIPAVGLFFFYAMLQRNSPRLIDKEDELIETMQLARNTGFSWV